jgi:RNA polymerase-binding transcription factor DksA
MARRGHAVSEPAASAFGRGAGRTIPGLMALLRERRRLLEPLRAPRDRFTPDVLDAAKDIEEERLWLAVSERRREIQEQIEEAVLLLLDGRYGRCAECRRAISPGRLRALPFAVRCLGCQERFEKQRVTTRHDVAPGLGEMVRERGGTPW